MRKVILSVLIKGLQCWVKYLIEANRYNLQNAHVQRYNLLLDKYVVAYQKLLVPAYYE